LGRTGSHENQTLVTPQRVKPAVYVVRMLYHHHRLTVLLNRLSSLWFPPRQASSRPEGGVFQANLVENLSALRIEPRITKAHDAQNILDDADTRIRNARHGSQNAI
jgi:hypothetical protein